MFTFILGMAIGGLVGVFLICLLSANQRRTADRRFSHPARFPVHCADGSTTLVDRRHRPDRRLNSLPA